MNPNPHPPQPPHQGGYPQQPVPYGGYPPYGPGMVMAGPVKMPGAAITVRVLMFIGGGFGLLFAVLLWLAAVVATGEGEFSEDFLLGAQDAVGMPISAGEVGLMFTLISLIPLLYGAVSLLLASLLGRRRRGVLWSVVVFQGLAALYLVLNTIAGSPVSLIPLVFAGLMIVLMLLEGTRAYYTRPAPAAY